MCQIYCKMGRKEKLEEALSRLISQEPVPFDLIFAVNDLVVQKGWYGAFTPPPELRRRAGPTS